MSHDSRPNGPIPPKPSTMATDEIAAHPPVPKGYLRTAVSDGSITIFVTGRLLEPSAVERLCAELDFATSVCRGMVTIDLTDCTELGTEAAQVLHRQHSAARASQSRYRFRVIVDCASMIRALAAGGVQLEHDARRHRTRTAPPRRHAASLVSLRTA
ncbi:hypothetical protein [Amycolatopsis sp. FDAARGOS 1241]|uniref:hypothetical protein n=1 Tax=Amycolatopsis sp. FDAARGOS 1241 TaxID=2778070 RepID=UPI001951D2E7|nr:hypothetical protein [Amycolatopsis sp. FDAARGOS 1241]QRP48609.1 hypothetical protein I6J71_12665 [Amycolatopsis sp. FDAARGOS 1241]